MDSKLQYLIDSILNRMSMVSDAARFLPSHWCNQERSLDCMRKDMQIMLHHVEEAKKDIERIVDMLPKSE